MVRFDDLRLRDGTPIYLQIMEHLKAGIAAGTVQDGDELPSRRTLSALLGVNPNTIHQAMQQQLPNTQTLEYIEKMRAMGLTRSQTVALIETLWKEDVP